MRKASGPPGACQHSSRERKQWERLCMDGGSMPAAAMLLGERTPWAAAEHCRHKAEAA